MTVQLLEQYLYDAERAFEQEFYLEGKGHLENALVEEPTFGKAHNHMGWLHLYHLVDFDRAERHLKLALKYEPKYSAVYIHMTHLLFESNRLDEHEALLKKATDIPGLSRSYLFNEYGRLNEVRGYYKNAIRYYQTAMKWSLDDQEINVIKDNIRRCRNKKWAFLLG